jgi:hypothetical protein
LAARRTSRQLGSRRRGIYDKFDGEFASRSQTYASRGPCVIDGEVTSVIGVRRAKAALSSGCKPHVVLCRRGKAEEALRQLRMIMGKLKLRVNEEKTRICKVPEGEFDFLGYTFGRMYSAKTGQARLGYRHRARASNA